MWSSRLRRLVGLQVVVTVLFGWLAGLVFTELLADYMKDYLHVLWPWLLGGLVVLGAGALVAYLRAPAGLGVVIEAPLPIATAEEARRYARRGFVGYVPLFASNRGTAAASLKPEEREEAIKAFNFDRLQIEESNFAPTIHAIMSHASRLEHCWLVATCGKGASAGSQPYAGLLVEYLRRIKGLKCQFHYPDGGDDKCLVSIADDAAVVSLSFRAIKSILADSQRMEIEREDMIADLTTGVRSMTMGMIMACLEMDYDLEFVGSHYDGQGNPQGDLFPTIYHFGSRP